MTAVERHATEKIRCDFQASIQIGELALLRNVHRLERLDLVTINFEAVRLSRFSVAPCSK